MINVVILAAGRGSRLAGVMPPFLKPLMTINGQSLLVTSARQAGDVLFDTDEMKLTVVTAPENTLPIVQLLNDAEIEGNIVVQRNADGPASALELALDPLTHHTMVLMGDNTMEPSAISRVITPNDANIAVVGGRVVTDPRNPSIESFTRFRTKTEEWVEKVPVTSDDESSFVWLGPLYLPTEELHSLLKKNADHRDQNGERPIGPLLGQFTDVLRVNVSCTDIGVMST